MRGALVLTLMLVAGLVLAGCSTKKDDSTVTSTHVSTVTSRTTITRTTTGNTTSLPPNVPPVLKLATRDAGGNVTNVTFVGGSLTFDASGSADPDSDGLSQIAILVSDSNRTYQPGLLYGNGAFTPVTYKFDRPGVVNITLSGIDGRGDVTTLQSKAFVDQMQEVGKDFKFSVPLAATQDPAKCSGPSGGQQPAADNTVWSKQNFNVEKGAQYVVATIQTGSSGKIALCDPTGKAISAASTTSTTSTKGTVFVPPAGADNYFVSVYGGAANTPVIISVVIHYEPQP